MLYTKGELCLSLPWRPKQGIKEQLHHSKLHKGEWLASCPGCFTSGRSASTLKKRLHGHHSWSGHFTQEKHFVLLLGIIHALFGYTPVTILTTLSWLQLPHTHFRKCEIFLQTIVCIIILKICNEFWKLECYILNLFTFRVL